MSEITMQQQIINLFKQLQVDERIATLHKLFDDDELFDENKVSLFNSTLSFIEADRLNVFIKTFIGILADLDKINKDDISKIIDIKISDNPSTKKVEYITTLANSLDTLHNTFYSIIDDKLVAEKHSIKVIDPSKQYVQQSKLAEIFGLKGDANITIQRTKGYFGGEIGGNGGAIKVGSKIMIPYDTVTSYVKTHSKYKDKWNDYLNNK